MSQSSIDADPEMDKSVDSSVEMMDQSMETMDKPTERLNSSGERLSESDLNRSFGSGSGSGDVVEQNIDDDDGDVSGQIMTTTEIIVDNVDNVNNMDNVDCVDDMDNHDDFDFIDSDGRLDNESGYRNPVHIVVQDYDASEDGLKQTNDQDMHDILTPTDFHPHDSEHDRSDISTATSTQSGKYTLRSARHADPLHFIHKIRLNEVVDPEMEELVTVIRTTETTENIEDQGRSVLQSLITSELVRQFENSGADGDSKTAQNNPKSDSCIPETEFKYRVLPNVSKKDSSMMPNPSSDTSQQRTSVLDMPSASAPIASLSDLDLSDDSDLDLQRDSSLEFEQHVGQAEACPTIALEISAGDAIITQEFEHVRDGELPSPTHQTLSLKEELADQEEEKGKDQSSRLTLDELDLPCTEEPRPGLNLDASKQKVQLRQRGSLANRRKPTRTSIRSTSTGDDSVFSDNRDAPMMNGHDPSLELSPTNRSGESSPVTEHTANITNIDMSAASQVQLIRPGRPIHGIKTAIVQSDVVESGRQRLRSVPTPGSSDLRSAPVAMEEDTPVTPPWLIEARLRRSSRPSPHGETEKLKQETEPEKPAWMKEAMMSKKKRAASRTSQSSIEEAPSTSEAESPKIVPWMQETARRRSVRTMPLTVSQKDVTNNVNNMIADSSCSTKSDLFEDISDRDTDKGQEVISSINNEAAKQVNGHVQGQENLPPPLKRVLSPEPSPAKKTYTQQHSVTSPTPDEAEQDEPTWKAEVAIRRKSKSYIVAQKPEQPLRLGEMPQWKRDLMEKNKQRRVSSDGGEAQSGSVRKMEVSEDGESIPPWRHEVAQRRSTRLSSSTLPEVFAGVLERPNSTDRTPEEEPEWAQLVAKRRQRLASSGLLVTEESASTNE